MDDKVKSKFNQPLSQYTTKTRVLHTILTNGCGAGFAKPGGSIGSRGILITKISRVVSLFYRQEGP